MARGWHYAKLLSSPLLSFSGMCILFLFLLYRFCFVFVTRYIFFFCPADHVQYRIGMVFKEKSERT